MRYEIAVTISSTQKKFTAQRFYLLLIFFIFCTFYSCIDIGYDVVLSIPYIESIAIRAIQFTITLKISYHIPSVINS